MNIKDEMQYQVYKEFEDCVKPGILTKKSKNIAQKMFDHLIGLWRQSCVMEIEKMTDEILREKGYVKKDDDNVPI